MQLEGKYGTAIIYNDHVEKTALDQIKALLDTRLAVDANIRVMPDIHAGIGCVIGTTMQIHDAVCPNLVGVDIGCGVLATSLGQDEIDPVMLDRFTRKQIPSGFKTHAEHKEPHEFAQSLKLEEMVCADSLDADFERAYRSIGTLGGGNHFIEIAVGADDTKWLIAHSGSRNIGYQVANHYQELAERTCTDEVPFELKYLTGTAMENYLADMAHMQRFARVNREAITRDIVDFLGRPHVPGIHTVHNYVDDAMMLRKGAVSAHAGEQFIIPFNMADGSLLCAGKGNAEWNFSAPHGAGRTMSRSAARKALTMADFRSRMKDIYSTSVHPETLDEAPAAYKDAGTIEHLMEPTATVVDCLKPIYSFKAHGGGCRSHRRKDRR